eukprot:g5407.t1
MEDEAMPARSTALRMFLMDDSTAVGVFTRPAERTGEDQPALWERTIVVEPSGKCFSVCDAQSNAPEGSVRDISSGMEALESPSICHHLTEFCASGLLPSVSQLLAFRNTYAPDPVLVWHAPTGSFLGVTVSGSTSTTTSPLSSVISPAPAHVLWPDTITSTWCDAIATSGQDNGAVRIRSVDGMAEFVLAEHGQMCRVTFPVATFPERGDSHIAITANKQYASVTQLIWVPQCPDVFAHPLALAQELTSHLVNETSSEVGHMNADGNNTEGTGSFVEGFLPKPPTLNDSDSPSWSAAIDIDQTGGSGLATESALLCIPIQNGDPTAIGSPRNHQLPPLSKVQNKGGRVRRVTVEWAPQEMYWNSRDGNTAGCFLLRHAEGNCTAPGLDDNRFHTFMSCTSAGYIRTYRLNPVPASTSNANAPKASTVICVNTSDAHVPDIRERHAVRHMLAHLAHVATARQSSRSDPLSEEYDGTSKPANAPLPSSLSLSSRLDAVLNTECGTSAKTQPSLDSIVVEQTEIPGIGRFCCYRDGRIRCVYENHTIVRIDGATKRALCGSEHLGPRYQGECWDWSDATAEVVHPEGTCKTVLCGNPVGKGIAYYVSTAVEFGIWAMASPEQRTANASKKQNYYNKIYGEANRIHRFLTEERIVEDAVKQAADPARKLNGDKEAVQSIPSREVLSAMAMQAVQSTSHFIEKI